MKEAVRTYAGMSDWNVATFPYLTEFGRAPMVICEAEHVLLV